MRRAVLTGALLTLVSAAQAQSSSSSVQANSSSLLAVAPNLIQFPAVPLGMISSQTVRIVNSAQFPMIVRKALASVSALTVSGLSRPIVLAAGEAVSLTVAYRPETVGRLTGKVILQGDGGGSSSASELEINVSGEAVRPKSELAVESGTMDFGTVQAGSSSRQTLRVTNAGNQDVQIAGVAVSGSNFDVRSVNGIRLAAGQTVEMEVNFHPAQPGTAEESLDLRSSATNSSIRIAVRGEAEKRSELPITLHWQGETEGAHGYFVYRGTALQGPFEKLNAVPTTSTEFVDESPSAGRQYFYVVTSVNETGDEGPFSEPLLTDAP